MTFIFWQVIISPHQMPFLKALALREEVSSVLLVVSKGEDQRRAEMGWDFIRESTEKLQILVTPSEEQTLGVMKHYENAHHFFSGITAIPMVFRAFKKSLDFEVRRYLIVEGPFYYKKPKFLHSIKTLLKEQKYFKFINKVYAIGSHSREWYKDWGFSKDQVIPFAYCVDSNPFVPSINEQLPKLIFVGSLIKRKGVDLLINALRSTKISYKMEIIGNGNQTAYLEDMVDRFDLRQRIFFKGVLDNRAVREHISHSDVLVLPSRHDGWGAVVNEALMAGLFVICSDKCGASDLIKDKFNGIVFTHQQKNSLTSSLDYCIENIDRIRRKKALIHEWSKKIEGKEMAKYMVESIEAQETVTPPWLR